jgi:hypothetical protein
MDTLSFLQRVLPTEGLYCVAAIEDGHPAPKHGYFNTVEELAKVTGYTRAADIRRCLERQGITVRLGRGGRIWTTLGAIEGRRICAQDTAPIDFA